MLFRILLYFFETVKTMSILLNNLTSKISENKTAIFDSIKKVLSSGWVILGPEVKKFEEAFACYLGAKYCIGVANGTDAIELALKSFDISKSDMVATVANAGAYTTNAILAIGAKPFFLDVDSETFNTTSDEVYRAIKYGVKAVVATHLYGLAIQEIDEIAKLCTKYGVYLLEDCAQSHGASVNQKYTGTFGDASAFSFYPTKNLGALGDGGAVVSNNAEISTKVRGLRQYGWSTKYKIEMSGARNSRLDEIQAAILQIFLSDLELMNEKRRHIANRYSKEIKNISVVTPGILAENYVAHLYVIKSKQRNLLKEYLKSKEIASDIHYPIPDHRQPFFENQYEALTLKNTEELSNLILTLPCYPEMPEKDIENVISTVNEWKP
jgi:dTDP-4-amino-4,6-dideoxygalactose transaminase